MDQARARELLQRERVRVESLLEELSLGDQGDKDAAAEGGDIADPAGPLTDEQGTEATVASLRDRLEALDRAEDRLDDGTYGRSVRSGAPIGDERLEADPAAELTVDEQAAEERGRRL